MSPTRRDCHFPRRPIRIINSFKISSFQLFVLLCFQVKSTYQMCLFILINIWLFKSKWERFHYTWRAALLGFLEMATERRSEKQINPTTKTDYKALHLRSNSSHSVFSLHKCQIWQPGQWPYSSNCDRDGGCIVAANKMAVTPVALFTQRRRIISAAVVRQFSAIGHSHRVKPLRLKDELLCNSHRKRTLRLLKRRDGTRHDDDAGVFPRCPAVNLILRIVYNHMDAVLMYTSTNGKWKSYIFHNKSHNYIIAISKLDAVWLTRGDGGCFLGESSRKSRSGGLTVAVIYFHHQHLVSSSFLSVTYAVFQIEMWRRVSRTVGRTDKFHPSPHRKLSHRGGGEELVQDTHMQTAVWMGIVSLF